eukprot:scaffold7453_cov177-Amphora_coffeaeformis.AAC.4
MRCATPFQRSDRSAADRVVVVAADCAKSVVVVGGATPCDIGGYRRLSNIRREAVATEKLLRRVHNDTFFQTCDGYFPPDRMLAVDRLVRPLSAQEARFETGAAIRSMWNNMYVSKDSLG